MSAMRWSLSLSGAMAVALGAGSCKAPNGDAKCTTDSDCASAAPPTTPEACATGTCSAGACVFSAMDQDGDGHPAAHCTSTNGIAIQVGDDCNDRDPNLYPGHPESCSALPDGGEV